MEVKLEFLGYPRKNSSIGIRNYVAVIPTVNCVNYLAVKIAVKTKGVIPLTHLGNCSYMGKDKEMLIRFLIGLGSNPNIGGVLVVGAGCEIVSAEEIASKIAITGKPTTFLVLNKCRNINNLIEQGIRITQGMYTEISKIKKEKIDLSHLSVGVKCGGSDTTSGLSSNPVTGKIVDKIVSFGGTAIVSEPAELIGAEQVVSERAIDCEVKDEIYRIILDKEKSMLKMGVDIRNCEPTPGNIQGGLTTIEEKSLGAVAKSGNSPIKGVLKWGEEPSGKGLFLMDGSCHSGVVHPGFASAGTQISIFSIGGGIPRMLPMFPASSSSFQILPIIKLTGNPKNLNNNVNKDYIDVSVSSIISGKENIEEASERVFKFFLQIISGEKFTISEIFTNYLEPMPLYSVGPIV